MDVANPLLDRCRQLFHQQWRRELAILLQQTAETADRSLRLSSVVLDLGEIPLTHFDEYFCQRLLAALAGKLQSRMAKTDLCVSLTDATGWPTVSNLRGSEFRKETAHSSDSMQGNALTSNAETPPVAATLGSQLATFLNLGVTTSAVRDGLASPSDSWLLMHLKTEPASWRRHLAGSCLRFDAMVRLLRSAEHSGLSEVCDLLFERKGPWPRQEKPAWAFCLVLGALLTQAHKTSSKILAPDRVRFMQLMPPFKLSPDILSFLAEAIVQLTKPAPSPAVLSWLRMLCLESGQWQHLAPHIDEAKRHRLHRLLMEESSPSRPSPPQPSPTKRGAVSPQGGAEIWLGQEKLDGQNLLTVTAEPWPVCNAGLVLLWPLLPGVFSRLGLQKDGQFIDQCAQYSAVGWLDEWLWENRELAEWRMPFTKLLCGMALDTSLFPSPVPNAAAMASLDELLNALLAQIPALKHCSGDDMRRWFLQRPGWLHCKDQQWTLQVEQDACDVLLVDLPWPKNHVLLPWMESPLNIIWPE
jgi:hypothetical protein